MRKALGRGLDALIPGAGRITASSESMPEALGEAMAPIDQIHPNPRQPRVEFDEAALAELEASIRQQGVIQPLLVRRLADDEFELIAGERRLRAAERAGLTHVPIFVRDVTEAESLEMALVENIQRNDLSPLEEAAAYQKLTSEFGYTQEQVAARVGKSRPAIANTVRLLRLPDSIKQDLARGRLTVGHARVLLSIEDADGQLRAAKQMLARRMSVRDAEQLAAARRKVSSPSASRDPHRGALERDLSSTLGTRVRIMPKGRGGRIEIEFYSPEELQGLVDRLVARDR
jgi:ParB family transcriptional regulator, chromosome partitioning protein